MTLSARLSKSGMVALLASTMFMVACADNRGFDSIRVKSPIALDTKTTTGQENDQNQNSGDDSAVYVSEEPKVLAEDEEKKLVDEMIETTTITYTEGAQGKKELKDPKEIQQEKIEAKEDLNAIISETKALDAKSQILKGLSIIEMQGSTAEKKDLEVNVVVETSKTRGGLTAVVGMTLDKNTKKMAGVTSDVKWHQADLGVKTEVRAVCAGSAEDLCSTINVLLRFESEGKIQAFVTQFVRGENGMFVLEKATSKAIVGFVEAQNGVERKADTPEEQKSEPQQNPQENQQGEEELNQPKGGNETQDDAAAKAELDREAQRAQGWSLMGKKQAEQKAQTPSAAGNQSFRQAEAESMKKYEAYKAEMAQKKNESKAVAPATNGTQSFRQAEAESMKKYEAYKADLDKRQADLKAEMARETQRAQGYSLMGKKQTEQAKVQSYREAEIASMKKLETYKAQEQALAQKKTELNKIVIMLQRQSAIEKAASGRVESLPIDFRPAAKKSAETAKVAPAQAKVQSFREAEIESMKKYEQSKQDARKAQIQKILNKNKKLEEKN